MLHSKADHGLLPTRPVGDPPTSGRGSFPTEGLCYIRYTTGSRNQPDRLASEGFKCPRHPPQRSLCGLIATDPPGVLLQALSKAVLQYRHTAGSVRLPTA